jgi:hypothetical protein
MHSLPNIEIKLYFPPNLFPIAEENLKITKKLFGEGKV